MEGDKFCTRCGAELPDGSAFCPECGSPVGGGFNHEAGAGYGYSDGYYRQASRPALSFAPLILVYGILAAVFGLLIGISVAGLTEASYNELIQTMTDATGVDYSTLMPAWSSGLVLMLCATFFAMAASGILAILCYIQCRKAENWKLTVILCGASTAACLVVTVFSPVEGLVMVIVGALMTYLIYNRKDAFLE
ncbi:MAG: zinc ribbon domain-containing protein [Thermoplasmata archaeon]|nr:zinc ribbon domain-containing protein [Thermoplasmata archaeon]